MKDEGLKVGQPGDKYEQEADAMADAVINKSSPVAGVQKKTADEEDITQAKIQRKEIEEEPEVQMQAEEEELQMQEKEEEIQRQEEDEEELQMKEKEEEEEPELQTKSSQQSQPRENFYDRINRKNGTGRSIESRSRQKMEAAFGRDFGGVNVHTDPEAVQLNQELHAHAFTQGRDIYFNSGKYQPGSVRGQHLLAHELTHVVQQSEENGIQKAVQLLRVSSGGFGKTLEGFTNLWNISDSIIRRLRDSWEFMAVARNLDRHYVDRNSSYRYNPIYDADDRITGGDRGMPRSYIGKKELFITRDTSGASFMSFQNPDNILSGDVISIQNASGSGFIQDIVHEACHAYNHVAGGARSAPGLVASIESGIQEEIGVRNKEASILNEINTGGSDLGFNPVGSTIPAQVERDFAPGIGLTYLENFFFSFRLRETLAQDGLTDVQASQMREKVSNNPDQALVFKPEVNPQSGLFEISEYGITWRDRVRAKQSWQEFDSGSQSNSAAAREARLQEHARRFFKGLVRYSNLP